jgi:hypothetical protein
VSKSKDQERALGRALREDQRFCRWLLSRTRFRNCSARSILVRDDWPWYQSPRTGRQSETDILAVFQPEDGSRRFALHVENKTASDRFQPDQPALYRERGTDWIGVEKWGSYSEFACILTAPRAFCEKHFELARQFDYFVSHETLATRLPIFAEMATSVGNDASSGA